MKKILGSILTLLGAGIILLSLVLKVKGQMAVSVAGGADGPTSVVLAGPVGGNFFAEIIVGVIVLLIGILVLVRKKS
jgi:oxaloacetate decarboxylase beta subunit